MMITFPTASYGTPFGEGLFPLESLSLVGSKLIAAAARATKCFPIRTLYSGRGVILALHRVVPGSNRVRLRNEGLEIEPGKLDEILQTFLSFGYTPIAIDDLKHHLQQKKCPKFFIVTFDDGYRDNYELAYPILKGRKIPFTIYITSGYLMRTEPMWWYSLEELLLSVDGMQFRYKNQTYRYSAKSLDEKYKAFHKIRNIVNELDIDSRKDCIAAIFDNSGIDPLIFVDRNALTIEQLRALSDDPLVTIGAHTHSHPSLRALSVRDLVSDVKKSVEILERVSGKPIRHFAYPFGSRAEADQREIAIIQSIGFETATTVRSGNIFREHIRYMHSLPRFFIDSSTDATSIKCFISGETPCMNNPLNIVVKD